MNAGRKTAPVLSKQLLDMDADTISQYRALEERYVAEVRQVRPGYSPRPAALRLSSGESPPGPVVELMENQP